MSERTPAPPRGGILTHVAAAFLVAAIFYAVAYHGVEYLRQRKGGWEVTFRTEADGAPQVRIMQPHLGISNVVVTFPDQRLPQTNLNIRLVFDRPLTNVPFGRVVYLDTTFLPGAVVFDLFGHEIQLLPRVLMIDRQEYPWRNSITHSLTAPVPRAP